MVDGIPLVAAIEHNEVKPCAMNIIKTLLEAGTDVNFRNDNEFTQLHSLLEQLIHLPIRDGY